MFENVVLNIGSKNFARTVLSNMHAHFGVHQMALFRLMSSGTFEPLMHDAVGDKQPLEYSIDNYLHSYYQRDPLFPFLKTSNSREVDVRTVNAEQISGSELHQRLYQPFRIAGKMCLIVRRPTDVLVASFFRTINCGAYASVEHTKLLEHGGTLAAALERHLKLMAPSRNDLLSSLVEIFESMPTQPGLSKREAEICARIIIGQSNEAISLSLGISFHSVTTYRRRAYEKLKITASNELFGLVMRERALFAD